MASSNQTPDVLFSPIAANADASDINTIPQTYDPANYGYAAQNVGFPTECRLPVLNHDGTLGQGRAPRMQDWNGIMKLVSSHNFFLQNGGSYTFNPTVSSNIGGYPKNAVLWYFPENEAPCLVYSLINDNTNNFVDDPTLIDGSHWEMLVNPSNYANINLSNLSQTGEAHFANPDLSNLSAAGEAHFQKPLVSGSTIKTLNNESLLGSGNIEVRSVTAKWSSGYNWYRKWSDGWIEQGGPLTLGTYGYNFLTSFSASPTVLCSRISTTAVTAGVPDVVDLKTQASTTGFTLAGSNFNSAYFAGGRWFACGY